MADADATCDLPLLLVVSASASPTSRSEKLADHVAQRCAKGVFRIRHLKLRTLPAGALLSADTSNSEIAAAVALIDQARGLIVATPTYKGAFSGILKVFLDLLPQYALRGKMVFPLATGGSVAHVMMLDYALRPVLQTMWPRYIAQGCFVLDRHIECREAGDVTVSGETLPMLDEVVDAFRAAVASAPSEQRTLQP
jgi:FMN reductase